MSDVAPAPAPPALERSVGLFGAVAFGLGAMIGTGVFVYTGVAAGFAGPAMLVSLGIAGLAATCNGLASAELAMNFPRSGGTYEYARRMLSPWAGYLAGWLFLAAKTTSAAATAIGFGAYVGSATGAPPPVVSLALVAAVTALNLFRLRAAGVLNIVLVTLAVGGLLAFVVTGWRDVARARFEPFAPSGLYGVLSASALLFVAYAGYGRVATLGEEIRDPAKNIPRAVVLSLAAAALLYVLVSFVAVGSIGAPAFAAAAGTGAPLEHATARPAVKIALSIGAAAALGAVFLNLVLGLSRMTFAMAREEDLPRFLSRVSSASSPFCAVLAVGLVLAGLVALGNLVRLVSISAFTVLIYYGLTNWSALRLGREQRLVHPAVPVLGLLFCLALAASVPVRHLLVGAGVLAAGALWRLTWGILRPRRG
jgi:APA family basic amino acid/polyamine antiporter